MTPSYIQPPLFGSPNQRVGLPGHHLAVIMVQMLLSPAAVMYLPLWQGLAWSFPAIPGPEVFWILTGSHGHLPEPVPGCVLRSDGCIFCPISIHSVAWENSLPHAHRPKSESKILLELNSEKDTERLKPTNQPTKRKLYVTKLEADSTMTTSGCEDNGTRTPLLTWSCIKGTAFVHTCLSLLFPAAGTEEMLPAAGSQGKWSTHLCCKDLWGFVLILLRSKAVSTFWHYP